MCVQYITRMPSYKFVIKSSHYVGNNRFVVPMRNGITFPKGSTISLDSFAMYNSTFNISGEQFDNNWVRFTWIDNVTRTWYLSDGYYSIDSFNMWLQSQFIANGMYVFTDADKTEAMFYVQLRTNSTTYKSEIVIPYVGTQADATANGYSKSTGATWSFPSTRKMVVFEIAPKLKQYFGFISRTVFGDESTVSNKTYESDVAPRVSPIFSYIVTTNIVQNPFMDMSGTLAQIPINKGFGSLIEYFNQAGTSVDVTEGKYNLIEVQLWSQDETPLVFYDKDVTIVLSIQFTST